MDMSIYQSAAGNFLSAKKVEEDKLENKPMKISKIEEVELNDKKKPLLSFEGTDNQLVLNATNTSTLIEAYGKESDAWVGKEISLFVVPGQFKGERIKSIVVKAL